MNVTARLLREGANSHLKFTPGSALSMPVLTSAMRAAEFIFLIVASTFTLLALQTPALALQVGALIQTTLLATFATWQTLSRVNGAAPPKRPGQGWAEALAHARLVATAIAVGMIAVVLSLALHHLPYTTTLAWAGTWGAVMAVAVVASRSVMAGYVDHLRLDGRLANKVAVIGDQEPAAAVAMRLMREDPTLFRVTGRYALDVMDPADPVRGDLSTLMLDCRLGGIDSVLVALRPADQATMTVLKAALANYAVDIYVVPEDIDYAGLVGKPASLGQEPLLLINERPLKDWSELSKTLFDRCCTAMLLVVLAPFLLVVAAIIKLDSPGPVFFRQLRVGYNNQLFGIYKFRTMRNDATDRLATVQTTRGDVRVTRVGRILRKLSIDELPQLLNVLQGDMSLVGPRPHAPGTSAAGRRVDELVDNYGHRHIVKPGITGLAQVRGYRGGMTTVDHVSHRVRCDLEYIRRRSIWMDIKILVATVIREIASRRAF